MTAICAKCHSFYVMERGKNIFGLAFAVGGCTAAPRLPQDFDPVSGRRKTDKYQRCRDINPDGECNMYRRRIPLLSWLWRMVRR